MRGTGWGSGVAAPLAAMVAAVAVSVGITACGSDTTTADRRDSLEDYVAEVQPIRLGINELLDKADPILEGYREGDLNAKRAQRRFDRLERGVAVYAVQIAAVEDIPDELRTAHDTYAHTFVLQDTYLSALAATLPARAFDELPHFQNEQRAAIIAWRTRLQVLAERWGATLPADLQVAGRGEISPSPTGD